MDSNDYYSKLDDIVNIKFMEFGLVVNDII